MQLDSYYSETNYNSPLLVLVHTIAHRHSSCSSP